MIVSGYADFSYAREALQFHASDYLLKPVDAEELKRAIKKIKKSKKKKLEYSVIIFSNVPSLQMDQILTLLKENTTLCLKAIVTATNYNWTFEKLVLHLLEEYQKNK